jgi:hypothetical protein
MRATRWNPTEGRLDIEDGLRLLDEHYPVLRDQIEVFGLRKAGQVGSMDAFSERVVRPDNT